VEAAAPQDHAVRRGIDDVLGATAPLWCRAWLRHVAPAEEKVLRRSGDRSTWTPAEVRSHGQGLIHRDIAIVTHLLKQELGWDLRLGRGEAMPQVTGRCEEEATSRHRDPASTSAV
jgi:hypothetical protein